MPPTKTESGWTCPDCGRRFGARNRSHTCEPAPTADEYFADKPARLRPIYDAVAKHLDDVADVIVEPVQVGIFFKGRRNFAELRLKRDRRGVERFQLSIILLREVRHGRIRRSTRYGDYCVHYVDLYEAGDVDEDVLRWLTESCLAFTP